MNQQKLYKFLSIFWFTVALGTSIYGLMVVSDVGWSKGKTYIFLPLVAWAFFLKAIVFKKRFGQIDKEHSDES